VQAPAPEYPRALALKIVIENQVLDRKQGDEGIPTAELATLALVNRESHEHLRSRLASNALIHEVRRVNERSTFRRVLGSVESSREGRPTILQLPPARRPAPLISLAWRACFIDAFCEPRDANREVNCLDELVRAARETLQAHEHPGLRLLCTEAESIDRSYFAIEGPADRLSFYFSEIDEWRGRFIKGAQAVVAERKDWRSVAVDYAITGSEEVTALMGAICAGPASEAVIAGEPCPAVIERYEIGRNLFLDELERLAIATHARNDFLNGKTVDEVMAGRQLSSSRRETLEWACIAALERNDQAHPWREESMAAGFMDGYEDYNAALLQVPVASRADHFGINSQTCRDWIVGKRNALSHGSALLAASAGVCIGEVYRAAGSGVGISWPALLEINDMDRLFKQIARGEDHMRIYRGLETNQGSSAFFNRARAMGMMFV